MLDKDYEALRSLALAKLQSGELEGFDPSEMQLEELIESVSIFHAELQAQNEELQESLETSSQHTHNLNILFDEAPYPNILLKNFQTITKVNKEAIRVFKLNRYQDNYGLILLYLDEISDKTKFLNWIKSEERHIELTLKTTSGSKLFKISKSDVQDKEEHLSLLTFVDISHIIEHQKQMQKNYEEIIYSLITISEQKDSYTWGHSQRVAFYASRIAEKMGLNQREVDKIYKIGMLHDIGKIIVPESVLLKPDRLSDLEMSLMQMHVSSGYDILSPISMYSEIAEIVRSHHERYDGSGYPQGLKANEIPLYAQIIGIADTFDAMTTNRIYKGRKNIKQAVAEINDLAGIWFEPKLATIANSFFETLPEIKDIHQKPQTDAEKFRFSYFFKDQLTGVYNGEFLNIFLQENVDTNEYNCINFLELHNMHNYNAKHGWEKGNQLLKQFAKKLEDYVDHDRVFRVHGDDFITLDREHVDILLKEINSWDIFQDTDLVVSNRHYNLKENSIESWKKLEKLFFNPQD